MKSSLDNTKIFNEANFMSSSHYETDRHSTLIRLIKMIQLKNNVTTIHTISIPHNKIRGYIKTILYSYLSNHHINNLHECHIEIAQDNSHLESSLNSLDYL